MKIIANRKDKILFIASSISLVVGSLLMYSITTSQRNNPPPDADIGGGLVYLFGLALAILGGLCLLASSLYMLLRSNIHKLWVARLLALGATTAIALVGWWVFTGADTAQNSSYKQEIVTRYGSFVKYQEPVKLSRVSGSQSDAISVTGDAATPSSITLDLHACTPGAATLNDAGGKTYFAFSGVKKDGHTHGTSDCILYIGRQTPAQTWDGTLYAKCTWVISDDLSFNKRRFNISATGVQFGDFLGNCQDLRTGRAPTDIGH